MNKKILGILVVMLLIATVLPVLGSFEVDKNNIRKSPVARDCSWTLSFEQPNHFDITLDKPDEYSFWQMDPQGIKSINDETKNICPSDEGEVCTNYGGLQVEVTKPRDGYLYLFDREIMRIGFTVVIGSITIEVETSDDVEGVDIYLDDYLKFSDYTLPYSRLYNERSIGGHTIKVVAYDNFEETNESNELDFFMINLNKPKEHNVLINEIMSDPLGDDAGNEWIELYNNGDDTSIDGWVISNSDGNAIATLPDWLFPHDTYLVVVFGNGVNDNDFSDGNAMFYTGGSQEVFDNNMDECALYNGNPNVNSIIDFISYCYEEAYTQGTAYGYARNAGIWDENEYFNPLIKPSPYVSRRRWINEGYSIGRDSYSNDTNTPQDWDSSGGADAFKATFGRCNLDAFGIINQELLSTFSKDSYLEKKNWTIMVYMADCDLEDDFFNQLNDLEDVGTNDDMNIVFQIDGWRRTQEWYNDTSGWHQANQTKTFRGFLMKDNTHGFLNWGRTQIETDSFIYAYNPPDEKACIGEINTGTASPLTNFVNWAAKYAPADHYVLILGGHGAGWKGLLPDANSSDDYLYMHELKTALDGANILTFDILGFDCCLMAMVEVGYQIRFTVDYMVASEETDMGWDYEYIFDHLQNNMHISSVELANYMVDSYENQFGGVESCYTLSATRLKGDFNALVSKISMFGENLKTGMEDWGDWENVVFNPNGEKSDNCQMDVRDSLVDTEHYHDRNFKDLYHLAYKIGKNGNIYSGYKEPWQDILNLLVEGGPIITNEIHSNDHDDSHGLSIYFPRNQVDFYIHDPCDDALTTVNPFDYPWPSNITNPPSTLAIYAEDFTIEWGKVPYTDPPGPPHPWPEALNLLFRDDTQWDEFLHRYYKPCADAGKDQEFIVDDCDDCVRVTLNGGGSSSADDDLKVHRYTWDFDATIDSKAGMNPDVDDMDRSGIDDLDDEKDAENKSVTNEFCVGTHIVTLTVWDDHHLKNESRCNDFPNEHWKTDQDICIITVKCQEDDEEPDTHITSPQDGATVTSPINVTGYATDYGGSGVAELDYLLEWDGGSYDGDSIYIDPPEEEQGFILGPLYLEDYLDLEDEWLKITIYAIDAAGNTGSDSITVYRAEGEDTTPPITTATFDPELRVVTLTAYDPPHGDDPISGVCGTYYYIDDGTTQEYFEPFSLLEGTHDVTFWSVDCADNVEDPNTETFG